MASLTKTELNQMIESAVEKAVDKKFESATESTKVEVVEESVEALNEAYMQIVEENFLTFINESAESKELKALIKKLKKGKDITKEDFKKIEDLFASDESIQKQNKASVGLISAFLTAYLSWVSCVFVLTTDALEAIAVPFLGVFSAFNFVAIVTYIVSLDTLLDPYVLDKFYDKVMKLEAKAKAKLLKLENLDDSKKEKKEDSIKALKSVISNAD